MRAPGLSVTAAAALTAIAAVATIVSSAICALALSGTLAILVLAATTLQRTLGQSRVEAGDILVPKAEALGALSTLLRVIVVLLDAESLGAVGALFGFFFGGRRRKTHGERGRRRGRLGNGSGSGSGITLHRLSFVRGSILGRSIGGRSSLCSSGGSGGSGGGGLRAFIVAVRYLVVFGSYIDKLASSLKVAFAL